MARLHAVATAGPSRAPRRRAITGARIGDDGGVGMKKLAEAARALARDSEFAGPKGRWRALIWVFLPLVILIAAAAQPLLDAPLLFRDPVVAAYDLASGWTQGDAARPLWVGAMSTIGAILLTLPAGALILLCGVAARPGGDRGLVAFAACGAALTLMLTLDETLMLHEMLDAASPGSELWVLLGQAAVTAAYLAAFRRELIGAAPALTAYAIGLFAMSAAIDLALSYSPLVVVVEDGFKFLGVCAWTGAHMIAAARRLEATPGR
jgi:hypothetical protein